MSAEPHNPTLVAIPAMLFTAITAGLLLYCNKLMESGLDAGTGILLLIVGSSALLVGLFAISFIIRMMMIVSLSESITSLILIGLVVYAEILYAKQTLHPQQPAAIVAVETEPPASPQAQAYTSGVVWARARADETQETCEAQAKSNGIHASEFVRGCVLEIPITVPKLLAFDSAKPDYKVFDRAITQKILPLLPDGVALIEAKRQDAGFNIALRAPTKLEMEYDLAIKHIKDTFTQFKRMDFKSDGNVMEFYFYIEEKVVKPTVLSTTSLDEIEQKLRSILPQDVTLSFAIPSGVGFMVALETKPSISVDDLVNNIANSGTFNSATLKSTTQIKPNQQELVLWVKETSLVSPN